MGWWGYAKRKEFSSVAQNYNIVPADLWVLSWPPGGAGGAVWAAQQVLDLLDGDVPCRLRQQWAARGADLGVEEDLSLVVQPAPVWARL
eukprot:8661381-Pyramimonas_sp.AAC.1